MADKLWEEVKKGIKGTVSFVTEKTEELATVGRLKLDIAAVKRNIEKKFSELGKLVYGKMEKNEADTLASDEAIKALVDEISELENDLKNKEMELQEASKKEEKTEEELPSAKEKEAGEN